MLGAGLHLRSGLLKGANEKVKCGERLEGEKGGNQIFEMKRVRGKGKRKSRDPKERSCRSVQSAARRPAWLEWTGSGQRFQMRSEKQSGNGSSVDL